jgi:hypothetical protein
VRSVYEGGREPHSESAGTLILNFPVSRPVKNTFLLLINYHSKVFFVIAAQTD